MTHRRRHTDDPYTDYTPMRGGGPDDPPRFAQRAPAAPRPNVAFAHRMFVLALAFLGGLLVGMTICTVRADDWNTGDKVLFGTYIALSAYDAAQTDQGIRSGEYIESNPMFGERPSTARIVLTKAAGAGLVYLLADAFPERRRLVLWIANTLQFSVVARNLSIGANVKF